MVQARVGVYHVNASSSYNPKDTKLIKIMKCFFFYSIVIILLHKSIDFL